MINKRFSNDEQHLLEQVMMARRDVRGNRFVDRTVSDHDIDRIIQAAVLAPSVGFSQPWDFIVIRDPQIKQRVADNFKQENEKAATLFDDPRREQYGKMKLDGILETPVNIAVFYKPAGQTVLGQTSMPDMGEYSVVCAVQNMWLMARAMNIGIGWVSILDPDVIKEIVNAPAANKLVAYLCVGHVDEFLSKPELEMLNWDSRKPLDSCVHQNSY